MIIGMTGGKGKLGKYMSKLGVIDLGCDVTSPIEIEKSLKYTKPDVVLHLAAKSNVDFCQKPENQQKVVDVNVHGAHKVFEACEQYGCQVVLLSSDHVFSGRRWFGKYNEQSKASPVNYYGLTKCGAEGWAYLYDNAKIVRTSYLFDKERLCGSFSGIPVGNYPTFIKRNFIHFEHFSQQLNLYLHVIKDMPKVLHLAGIDSVSWFTIMNKINKTITPRRKDHTNGFAPRPHNLNLDVSLSKKLGFTQYSYLDGLKLL